MAIRPVEDKDGPAAAWLAGQLWGAPEVVAHGEVFRQRHGFRLAALRPGAVDRSREHKLGDSADLAISAFRCVTEIDLSCPV